VAAQPYAITLALPGHTLTACADQSRHDLVFGGSRTTRTMMHSCASAAKLE
jgi:hypothetical protein